MSDIEYLGLLFLGLVGAAIILCFYSLTMHCLFGDTGGTFRRPPRTCTVRGRHLCPLYPDISGSPFFFRVEHDFPPLPPAPREPLHIEGPFR